MNYAGSHHDTDLHPGISSRASSVRSHRDFMLWALHLRAGFHLGLARPLSRQSVFITGQTRQPTPFRALRRPLEARHGITIEDPYWSFLRLPRTRLSRPRPPTTVMATGLAARRLLLTPLMLGSGSSFPADSAKPVPLAVVSLDSR